MSRAGNEVFEMHVKNLAMRMPELVRQTAVKCLGRASGEWLLDQPLPGIQNHSHLQVIEHMLCEKPLRSRIQNRGGPKKEARVLIQISNGIARLYRTYGQPMKR